MASQDERTATFVARNKIYAQTHTPMPLWNDFTKMVNPAGGIVIISCFDARQNPAAFFGLKFGEAALLTNAGGRANPNALRSIEVLDALIGVAVVVVAHHTDCGLTHITDEEIKSGLKKRAKAHEAEIEKLEFGGIADLTQAIKDDMNTVKASPFLRKDVLVLGYLFDIVEGSVEEVVV